MKLSVVRDWLKSFEIGENFYIGKLDNKKLYSIGVYQDSAIYAPVMAIGGLLCSSYDTMSAKILIHWNKNADETEQAARELYSALTAQTHFYMGQNLIHYLELLTSEPVSVGTDEGGVYEWVISFNIYYERNEN